MAALAGQMAQQRFPATTTDVVMAAPNSGSGLSQSAGKQLDGVSGGQQLGTN